MIDVTRRLDAPAPAVWELLVDTTAWPAWGPSVRTVELSDGGTRIGPHSRGRVATAVGIWLPFEVTEWDNGHRWAWKVARIPATAHAVRAETGEPQACRATIEVPAWAPFYAPLCWVALGRIGRIGRITAEG